MDFGDASEATGGEPDDDTTTGEVDSSSSTDDDGALLDLEDEPEDGITLCDRVSWLTAPHVSELVGPAHHDGRLYWGEWGQEDADPDPIQTWRELDLHVPSDTELHASTSSAAHSLVVDEHYLYASGLDRNPIRIPVGGGQPESISSPLGYAEGSSELLLQADDLYWLNHSIDEITLMHTQSEALGSEVLLDGPLGGQLAGSEEAGLFVLRPVGPSTDILRVDPILGISEPLISLEVTSDDVDELFIGQEGLYVVYTSDGTAQIDLVSPEGDVTTIVEPGVYTLITHPVIWQDQIYFELADPEFGWGRVGIGGNTVEDLGEVEWNPRLQPMVALESCLVVRLIYEMQGNNSVFEILPFP